MSSPSQTEDAATYDTFEVIDYLITLQRRVFLQQAESRGGAAGRQSRDMMNALRAIDKLLDRRLLLMASRDTGGSPEPAEWPC